MKNLHILKTKKPSRLRYYNNSEYILSKGNLLWADSKNIYITSDEEIKKGDWIFSIKTNNLFKADSIEFLESHNMIEDFDKSFYINSKYAKKIILTTDPKLIADGVQPIDNEFLEWFVKNPSCEFVEVQDMSMQYHDEGYYEYKIIIPQGEPKQETLEEAAEIEKVAMDKLKSKWPHLYTFGYPQRPFPTNYENDLNNIKVGLYEGAKWQAERIPSIIEEYLETAFISKEQGYMNPQKWFEQFKKK